MDETIANNQELLNSGSANEDQYFIVSTNKLAVLYFFTLGLYLVYWFYKNWKLQQPLMTQKIMPPLRSFFYIFFTHSLFERISNSLTSKNIDHKFNAGLVATTFVALMLVSNIAGTFVDKPSFPVYLDFIWLAAFLLAIYPLQEAQDAVNRFSNDPLGLDNVKYSWKNILTLIIGSIFWLAIIVTLAVKISQA